VSIPVVRKIGTKKPFPKAVDLRYRNAKMPSERFDGLSGTQVWTGIDRDWALNGKRGRQLLSVKDSLRREWTIVPFAPRTVAMHMSGHVLEVNGLGVTYEQYFKWREHNLWVTRFCLGAFSR
jgi:hypothetical protein